MVSDGDAIYLALLAHATAAASLAAPTPAPIGDATSERIYNALLAAASSSGVAQVAAERVLLVASTTSTKTAGFLSTKLQDLTSPIPILIGVLVLLLGLFVAGAGARSLIWASHWGKPRGTFEGRAHLPGGVGGIVFGSIVSSTIAILFTLLIVSRQTLPTLGSWGTFAILVSTALPGAFVGSRFRFAARACVGLLGALSITLLLAATFRIGTLLPRLITLAVATILSLVLCLLPMTQRSISIFSALSAALLFVLGIDLLVHQSFVDLVGLLVAENGVGVDGAASEIVVRWTTSTAKGLVAVWCIVSVVSSGWQWYWSGAGSGDVDESWNSYLSSFVSSHPSALGSFTPEPSFFAWLFRRNSPAPLTSLPTRRHSPWDDGEKPSDEWDSDADTLRGRSDPPAKYGKNSWADDEQADDAFLPYERPAREMDAVSRLSGSTVWGDGPEKKAMLDVDEDEDLPAAGAEQPKVKQLLSIFGRSSSPARYSGRITPTTKLSFPPAARSASPTSNRPLSPLSLASTRPMSPLSNPPLSPRSAPSNTFPTNAVPATPSLINALQRVNAAQKQARGEPIPEEREGETPRQRQPSWDDWWKEVVDKADQK